jgi:sugar phosphate permease
MIVRDLDSRYKKMMKYRWIVWGTLLLAFIVVHLQRLSLGVLREELTIEFGLSSLAFANLGAIYFYIYMIMQLPVGFLVDTVGVRLTVTVGMLLAATGSVIFGFAANLQLLLLGRFLVGLGLSSVFVSILKTQTEWFEESQFGTLSGITNVAGNIGGLLAQTPLALLVAVLTWRNTFVAIGLCMFVLAGACYVLIRNHPEGISESLVGESSPTTVDNLKSDRNKLWQDMKRVFANPATWLSFILHGGYNGTFITIASIWGTSYLVDVYGLAKVQASNYLVIMLVGAALGGISIGKFSDYIRRRKLPMLIFGGINVLCWFYLVVVCNGKPLQAYLAQLLAVLGFSSMALVLTHAAAKEANPLELAGTTTALVNVGGFLGAALIPILLGLVFDKYSGILPVAVVYQRALAICLGASIFAFVCSLFIKETYCKNMFAQAESSDRE